MIPHLVLATLLACGKSTPPAEPAQPLPVAAPQADPPAKVSLASFRATAHDGAPRDISQLRGHPTVVWFYPKAATGG